MKVLHVVEVTHGGVVSLARTFAAHQHAAGLDVHVLAPPGVEDLAGTVHRWSPARRKPASLRAAVRALRSVVAAERPDVVHLHSFFPGLLGRLRRLPAGSRVVYQPHSWAFAAVGREPLAKAVAGWERTAVRRTDLTITNCRQELDEARARGVVGPATVVGLPLDTSRFAPPQAGALAKVAARAALGPLAADAERLVVCVGRLSRQKGQELLASAWEAAPVPGTVLALIGPGDTAEVLAAAPTTAAPGGSLRLVGSCDDVRPWLHAADLAVLPSRYEGQSVAMAEALAAGLPVVMTDVNGAREAVAPDDGPAAGAVVPVGAMNRLLEEVAVRLDDPARLEAEAGAARARAVDLFAVETVMGRILDAYTGNHVPDVSSTAAARSHR